MGRLEEDVKIEPGLVALELLKDAGDDGAGKAGLVPGESESLGGQSAGWPFCGRSSCRQLSFPLPITIMCAGTVMFMVAVKRLMPYAFTGNQRPA